MKKRINENCRKHMEESFGFNNEYEFLIYKYLCGAEMKKQDYKKLKDEDKYKLYKSWKDHVIDNLSVYDNDKLTEIWRYFNYRSNRNYTYNHIITSFVIPFIVSIILNTIFQMIANTKISNEPFKMIIGVTIYIAVVFFVFYGAYKMCNNILKDIIITADEASFLKDYREIIGEMIDARETVYINMYEMVPQIKDTRNEQGLSSVN